MNNEFSKVLFIINKFSGGGFKAALEGKIVETCARHNLECTIEFTQRRGHATELASAAAAKRSYDLVVAVGGDGTVNEVASGLLNSPVPMAILPKGSGNGLARHLSIPMKIEYSLPALFTNQLIEMDTFKVNGKLSLNVSGIGFDGHVANIFKDNKTRGLQGYARVALSEFLQFKEFEAEVIADGNTHSRKGFIIAIANSSQYGNNARVAPAASVTDGLLHLCFLKKVPPYRLDFIYSFFTGKIDQTSYCDIVEARNFTLKVKHPVAFHIDGEPCGSDSIFNIEILPRSLRILVPPESTRL